MTALTSSGVASGFTVTTHKVKAPSAKSAKRYGWARTYFVLALHSLLVFLPELLLYLLIALDRLHEL